MTYYDVFNGDADGICALQQLRLAEPREAVLITGVKRDIELLSRVQPQADDTITVLDISLDKNRDALLDCLQNEAWITYVDHHFAGEIPQHPRLDAIIDTTPNVCTSLLVNRYLDHAHPKWAVVGAFGDNLNDSALALAKQIGLDEHTTQQFEVLGNCINYNGYGETVEDLHVPPARLSLSLRPFADPMGFIRDSDLFGILRNGYDEDLARAQSLAPTSSDERHAVYLLPAQPWARRVSGVFANQLARDNPGRAHALLTDNGRGGYVVSVRAPLNNRQGADALCRQFPTGGGRAAAAGINELPQDDVPRFVTLFSRAYS